MITRLLILLCFFAVRVSAQTAVIDSLQKAIAKEKNQEKKASLLNQLAFEYRGIDAMQTRDLAREAYSIGQQVKNQKIQADALHKEGLSFYYVDSYDTAKVLYKKSLQLAQKLSDSSLIAQAYTGIGNVYRLQGINDTALHYLTSALRIYKGLNDKVNVAQCQSTIGDAYLFSSQYDKAMEYHRQSFKTAQETGNRRLQAFNLSSMGNNYHMRGDFKQAIAYHSRTIQIADSIGELNIKAGSLGTMADAYTQLYNYPKAIECFLAALDIAEGANDKHNMSFIYNGMSDLYLKQHDTIQAIKYIDESIRLSREIGDYNRTVYNLIFESQIHFAQQDTAKANVLVAEALQLAKQYNYPNHIAAAQRMQGQIAMFQKKYDKAEVLINTALQSFITLQDNQGIAECYKLLTISALEQKKYKDAIRLGEEGMKYSRELNSPTLQIEFAYRLWKAYQADGNQNKALEFAQLYIELKEQYSSEENTRRQAELMLQYSFDKQKEQERMKQAEREAILQTERANQKVILTISIVFLVIVSFFSVLLYRRYRDRSKQKNLLEQQQRMLQEMHDNVVNSINYSKNIQDALLPDEVKIAAYFKDHFVFYRPKDIVSGDFYFVGSPILNEGISVSVAAVGDCTGHGVPGAFLTMLGKTFLQLGLTEKSVNSSADALNFMNRGLMEILNKNEKNDRQLRDGMDISLITLNHASKTLQFAGANNSAYVIRGDELIILKPQKFAIGEFDRDGLLPEFVNTELNVESGDMVYLITDGFADQFGGPQGKKYKYVKLEQLFLRISSLNGQQQLAVLKQEFEQWKGDQDQVDDVCIMGIRI